MPYFSTEIPTYVIYTYDELNRIITTQSPAPNNQVAVTTTVYDGFKTTTNAKGQVKVVIKDVWKYNRSK